jgi:hypothetical protein
MDALFFGHEAGVREFWTRRSVVHITSQTSLIHDRTNDIHVSLTTGTRGIIGVSGWQRGTKCI